MPMVPPSFAMLLRKHLKNARLEKVEQLGFDRILKFSFDSKFGPDTSTGGFQQWKHHPM